MVEFEDQRPRNGLLDGHQHCRFDVGRMQVDRNNGYLLDVCRRT